VIIWDFVNGGICGERGGSNSLLMKFIKQEKMLNCALKSYAELLEKPINGPFTPQ
tara:strand:- start:50 stop:214 length:165 start_codon:yes stop_codon:yes gene_type:complete